MFQRKGISHNMLDQVTMVTRSKHTGRPIVQQINAVYGYWATIRFIEESEFETLMNEPTYNGPLHEAHIQYMNNSHLCG